MTLTKEQRAAIEYAISSLEQCGSEPEDPVVAKILLAMIDSSGTVEPTGGFDLERARGLRDFLQDDCAEVGDVWGEMIAEIERLRPYEKVAADLAACGSYVGIGPGEGELPIPERVRRCVNRLKETQHEYEQKIISKDARIKKLEDALVEERARGNHYGMEYEDAIEGEIERWIIDGEKDSPKFYLDRVREEARRQLQADGKIGPNADAKPRVWQITEDRVTAIDQGLRFLEWSNAKTGNVETKKRIAILKTMLEEAGDEHGFER